MAVILYGIVFIHDLFPLIGDKYICNGLNYVIARMRLCRFNIWCSRLRLSFVVCHRSPFIALNLTYADGVLQCKTYT